MDVAAAVRGGHHREVTAPGGSTMRERYFQWDEGHSHSFYVYESALPVFKRFAEHYLVEPAGTRRCSRGRSRSNRKVRSHCR